MQKLLIGILTLATAALAITCVLQRRQLAQSQAEVQAVRENARLEGESRKVDAGRIKELERAEARLEKQVKEFTDVTTSLRATEAAQSSNIVAMSKRVNAARTNANGGADAEGKGAFGKGMGEMLGKMMKDPAMREMMRDQQRATVKMLYSGLFKELKLSPEEKDKLVTLLSDSQMKNIEFAQGLFGGKKDDEATKAQDASVQQAKKETDAEVKALLGDDRFAQYTEYQKNIGERMQLDQFGTRLQAANLSLQDQQMSQLLQVLKEEKTAVPPVIPSDPNQTPSNMRALMTPENVDKQTQWLEDYNRRVLDRASAILSPEQLKEYHDFLDQQASMQKLGWKMAREIYGNGSDNSTLSPVPAAR